MAANYDSMSIAELEAEIGRIQGIVTAAYGEQLAVHDIMERKLKLIPIVPTAKDQSVL